MQPSLPPVPAGMHYSEVSASSLVRQTSALAALYKGGIKPLTPGDKVY